jgi:acyl-CoA oxidase
MPTYLEEELAGASFDHVELKHFFYESKERYEAVKKLDAVFESDPLFQNPENDHFLSRQDQIRLAVQRGFRAHEILKKHRDLLGMHSPLHGEGGMPVGRFTGSMCGLTDHFALFVQTIMGQGTPEQVREWLPKAINLEIIGTYAQTELGHGSNVRALETTATYEESTDSLIVHMPTITSIKWWPGALGLLATHAVLHVRLLVKGKDLGYHTVMVQLRDETHKPLRGVDVGDIGPKMGGNTMDAGYLRLNQVHIPRTNLLAKFQQLEKGGEYRRAPKQLAKIGYMTMMKARVALVWGAMGYLSKGNTIVLRYAAFRRQGFVDSKAGISGGEKKILDHVILQSRLFPLVGLQLALFFSSRHLGNLLKKFDAEVKKAGKDISSIDTSMLPELHATSAGMKSFGTEMVLAGLEEGRKCCGGQGFTYSSGIAKIVLDYIPNVTFEGDRIPMALQTSRVLLGALAGKVPKSGSFAYLARTGRPSLRRVDDVEHLVAVWEGIARNAVNTVGRQLYFSARKHKSQEKAWDNNHVRLLSMAQAHTLYQFVDHFAIGLKEIPTKAQPTATLLFRLFALTKLIEIPVVVSGITTSQGQMIDREVKQLLRGIRPDILAFTEAPAFSDRILNSLIARNRDDIYEGLVDWAKRSPLNNETFQQTLHKDVLSKTLDAKYLAKGCAQSKL